MELSLSAKFSSLYNTVPEDKRLRLTLEEDYIGSARSRSAGIYDEASDYYESGNKLGLAIFDKQTPLIRFVIEVKWVIFTDRLIDRPIRNEVVGNSSSSSIVTLSLINCDNP